MNSDRHAWTRQTVTDVRKLEKEITKVREQDGASSRTNLKWALVSRPDPRYGRQDYRSHQPVYESCTAFPAALIKKFCHGC